MTEEQIKLILGDITEEMVSPCAPNPEDIKKNSLYFHLKNGETLRSNAFYTCIDRGLVRMMDCFEARITPDTSRNYCVPCNDILYIESYGILSFPMFGSFRDNGSCSN